MQDDIPDAYYSKKLNSAQMNYTTIDKELICVIAILHELYPMLLGAELNIHKDHKKILMLVVHLNSIYNGSHMLMSTVLLYIMWKDCVT
jgi:hypothetical protein